MEQPRRPEHGDYASALALQVARKAGVPPRELAHAIAGKLGEDPAIQSVAIAGPGFLNIRLSSAAAGAAAGIIIEQGNAYGYGSALAGQRVNLEFVSANPTGPLHIGGVRWVAVGDTLARLLRAEGADVTTEYYFNDAGLCLDPSARARSSAQLLALVDRRPRRPIGPGPPSPARAGQAQKMMKNASRVARFVQMRKS